MPSNVREIRYRTDVTQIADAAAEVRVHDCPAADDLALLLDAIGEALRSVGDPPLSEIEMFRWSATVHHARRIASTWVAPNS